MPPGKNLSGEKKGVISRRRVSILLVRIMSLCTIRGEVDNGRRHCNDIHNLSAGIESCNKKKGAIDEMNGR